MKPASSPAKWRCPAKRDPAEYLPHYEKQSPGAIASHWIPMDPDLWTVENYFQFLAERRKLLAAAANDFLEKLASGHVPEAAGSDEQDFIATVSDYVPGSVDSDDEEVILIGSNQWVTENGLPAGELGHELTDDAGNQIAFLDLAWPNGLQTGLSQPVALLIDESHEVEDAASLAGYRCFSSPEAFRRYVHDEVLSDHESEAAEAQVSER